jgi:arsenical pump membrane protein
VTADAPQRLLALLVGVNVAPLVTPWGSLATLLWAQRCGARGLAVPVTSLAWRGATCALAAGGLAWAALALAR